MVENDQPIPGCQPCYDLEANGIKSRRESSRELYETYHYDTELDCDSPAAIDYSVGNLCNLKCVICGVDNSTSWIPDYQKMNPHKSIEIYKYDKHAQQEATNPRLLHSLKTVHFHGGGEPLLTNNHLNLLKEIKQAKGLGDVRVFYNTNATVRPSQEVLDIWAECKLIEIYFSIDDVGKRFEYQRPGSTWDNVENTVKWFYDNMPHNHMLNINCVWSYLNLYYLDEIYQWYQNNLSYSRFGDKVQLIFQKAHSVCEINSVSQRAYDVLISKFQRYPELLQLVNSLEIKDTVYSEKFFNYIHRLDNIRGNDFHNICPEWSALLT
jgi:organic radical activating enzyme